MCIYMGGGGGGQVRRHHLNKCSSARVSKLPLITPFQYQSWKGTRGIFNVRNTLSACCAHEGETSRN